MSFIQKVNRLFLLGLVFCSFSCQSPDTSTDTEKEPAPKEISLTPEAQKGLEILNKCITAHGGIDRWNAYEGIEYNLINNGKSVYQLTHLKDRRAYLKGDGYEVGFDGKSPWALPDASQLPGKSATFYYNLDFYFVAIPFVLKDPGVNVFYEGKTTINDREYETLKITYGSGVGFSPEDIYYTYIDPETYMMTILVYSVTYFDKSKSDSFSSAKLYSDYQDIQGIKMPHTLANYSWEEGVMGEEPKFARQVEEIHFLEEVPEKNRFEAPEGAAVE